MISASEGHIVSHCGVPKRYGLLPAALEESGLIERLLEIAANKVTAFGATEVTLTLDGLARLKQRPASILLDALAKQVSLFHAISCCYT